MSNDEMPQNTDEKPKQANQEQPGKQPEENKPAAAQTGRSSPRPPLFRR